MCRRLHSGRGQRQQPHVWSPGNPGFLIKCVARVVIPGLIRLKQDHGFEAGLGYRVCVQNKPTPEVGVEELKRMFLVDFSLWVASVLEVSITGTECLPLNQTVVVVVFLGKSLIID